MEKGKPDGLMPYATPELIRELVTLTDRLIEEVGEMYCEWDMVPDKDEVALYNKILFAMQTVRGEMTTPPPEPDKPEGKLMRRADGALYVKDFFDDEK